MFERPRRAVLRGIGVGTAVSLAGCSAITDGPAATETSSSVPAAVANPDSVRSCDERISGPFAPDHDDHVTVGPLTFALVRTYMPTFDEFAPGGTSVKARVVIDPGIVVTLVVPPSERDHVGLDYDWNDWYADGEPLEETQRSVRFEACGSEEPRQYNGGIVVAGPRCVTLDVWVKGEDEPREAVLPVGTRCDATPGDHDSALGRGPIDSGVSRRERS